MYKLRIYITDGAYKGNLDKEEFFTTYDDMEKRYKDISKSISIFALHPTAWRQDGDEWTRIIGY